jgi:hypothetical protein
MAARVPPEYPAFAGAGAPGRRSGRGHHPATTAFGFALSRRLIPPGCVNRVTLPVERYKVRIIMSHITTSTRVLATGAAVLIVALFLALPLAAQTTATPGDPGAALDPAATTVADPAAARQALIDILRDDAAREALIAELEARAQPDAELTVEDAPPFSLARRIATATQGAAEDVAARAAEIGTGLWNAPARLRGFGVDEAVVLVAAFGDLFLVVAATVAGFVLLRALARLLYRRMGARYRTAGPLARWAIFAAAELVDVGIVILAWAFGYVVAATAVGGFGEVAILHTLYLNAFLVVELVKVVLRAFVSPNASDLRPLALSDDAARRFYRVLNIGVSLLGYGLLLLVPIVNAQASFAAGRTLSALVSIAAVLFLAAAILRYRAEVADWLRAQGRRPLPPTGAVAPDAVPTDAAPREAVRSTPARSPRPHRTRHPTRPKREWSWSTKAPAPSRISRASRSAPASTPCSRTTGTGSRCSGSDGSCSPCSSAATRRCWARRGFRFRWARRGAGGRRLGDARPAASAAESRCRRASPPACPGSNRG